MKPLNRFRFPARANAVCRWLAAGLFLLLLCGAKPVTAYWPPLQNVEAWVNGTTVYYRVFDPQRNMWMQGSSTAQSSPTVINSDGIVAWYDAVGFMSYEVEYRTYDPALGMWKAGSSGAFGAQYLQLINDAGVVAWRNHPYQTADYYVNYRTYDPALSSWRADGSGLIPGYANMISGDGVVAWSYDHSGGGWAVKTSVYDPMRGSWVTGISGPYYGDLFSMSIVNATVYVYVGGSNYTRGYNHNSGSWYSGPTLPMAYFVGQPSSGNPPLWVWFTDMSLAATSWNWYFGGSGSSSERSPYHIFNTYGNYTVTETVSGPAGNDSYSRFIAVGSPPVLVVSPNNLTFNAVAGGSNPPNQTFQISNSGTTPFYFTILEDIPWLLITPLSGGPVPPSATVAASVNLSGLPPGNYQGDVIVNAAGAQGSPQSVHVTLNLQPGPILSVNPDSLNFEWRFGQAPSSAQIVTVSNIGITPLHWSSTINAGWASITPSSGSVMPGSADSCLCSIEEPFPGVGLHTGSIVINDPIAVGSPKTVVLILVCFPPYSPVEVQLTPLNPPIIIPPAGGSFSFNIQVTNNSTQPQTFDLWTEINLPGFGTVPILSYPNLTLAAGLSVNRNRTQQVPGFAPAGTYEYCAYVGDQPWVVLNCDSFAFVKQGISTGGSLGSTADWLCSGEGFEELSSNPVKELPPEFSFGGNSPNPFNPTTVVSFKLQAAHHATLLIYDISGRLVATLVNGWCEAGSHEVTFNGSGMPSGIYFCRLQAGEFNQVRKMVMLK